MKPETAGSSSSANAESSSTPGAPSSSLLRLNPQDSFPFWEIIRDDPWNLERCGDGVSCFKSQPHPCGFAKSAFDDIVADNPILGEPDVQEFFNSFHAESEEDPSQGMTMEQSQQFETNAALQSKKETDAIHNKSFAVSRKTIMAHYSPS